MKNGVKVFGLAVASFSSVALGSDVTTCKQGTMVRRVEIVAEGQGCQVQYHKDTESPGAPKTIYTAKSDATFCAKKAAEHVDKLKGMGWACEAGSAASEAPAAPAK